LTSPAICPFCLCCCFGFGYYRSAAGTKPSFTIYPPPKAAKPDSHHDGQSGKMAFRPALPVSLCGKSSAVPRRRHWVRFRLRGLWELTQRTGNELGCPTIQEIAHPAVRRRGVSLRQLEMPTLRLCIGEIAEALGLFGVAYIYLQIQSDPGIVDPLQVKAVLIATYLIIASASQAVIASRLRVMGLPVLGLNAIVVFVVFFLYWAGTASMRFVATLAILTVLFRLIVAAISLRVPTQKLYRFVSVLVGSPLLLAGFGMGYIFAISVYENYVFLPRTKE